MHNFWQEGVFPVRKDFINRTSTWVGTDTEENFIKNKPPGYTADSVFYIFNSNGFRTHEIDPTSNKDTILCLGCSHTEGVGVQNPWPVLLANYFPDYTVYNLGTQGSSADTVSRTLVNVASVLKPKIVFILWPDFSRFETYHAQYGNGESMYNYDSGYIKQHGHWNMNKWALDHYDELTAHNRYYQHKLIVDFVASKYDFCTVDYHISDVDNWGKTMEVDRARDNEHYGPRTHQHLADLLYKKYQSLT